MDSLKFVQDIPALSKAPNWLSVRSADIENILKSLSIVKSFVVKTPEGQLSKFHTSISELRETQEYLRTWVGVSIRLEAEAKRLLALAVSNYKDVIGKSFIVHKDKIEGAKSLEEKMLRLRDFVPEIKIMEEWEATLDNIKLLREAVEFSYDDLNKASMSLNLQVNVIRQQVLTGEIRIILDGQATRAVMSDNTLDSMEKASLRNKMGSKPNGTFELDDLVN